MEDGLKKAAREKGIDLPLEVPHILVDVSDKTLSVFAGEILVRRYDIATGSNPRTGVLKKGSGSTPLGEYKVVRKGIRESVFSRGSRFMEINFPAPDDIEKSWEQGYLNRTEYDRYYEALDSGNPIPADLPVSGPLGIQGNHFLFAGSESTDGSVALRNSDVIELFQYIPLGTPVVIRR